MESLETLSLAQSATLRTKLEASRHELLDLGLRNPLLNFRLSKVQGIAIVQEEAAAIHDVLVRQAKPMYFQAAAELKKKAAKAATSPLISALEQVTENSEEDVENAETTPLTEAERQVLLTDNKLQTNEPLAKLESRLLNTYYTARTSLEEQGVNILYLAIGMLTWYEADSSEEPRKAPLVLIPVMLERGTAAERFKLRHTGADVEGNLSLQAKLKASFGLALPLPEVEEDGTLANYFTAVEAAVGHQPRWRVEIDSIALSFFSFGKFMLYRDLDPAIWPAEASLLTHPAIGALLGTDTGFRDAAPSVSDTAFLDTESPAAELHQVLDADSSQLLALLAVHEGRNLVVQGPPGTGKSQTIANLLAEAIGAGKKVLFVAEKMAALEVVKRRLDVLGLGVACLELHSHKANKKALHEELSATLALGRPTTAAQLEDQMAQLPRYRTALNDYALAVNAPLGRSRLTAQQVAGELLRLRETQGTVELRRLTVANVVNWSDAEAAHAYDLALRVQATLQKTGIPQKLLFWGSKLTVLLPAAQDELLAQLRAASSAVTALQEHAQTLAQHLGLPVPTERTGAEALLPAARHAQVAPALTGAAVADPAWLQQASYLTEILQAGAAYTALHQRYDAVLLPESWNQQLATERAALLAYGTKWWKFISGDYRRARKQLQSLWRETLPSEAGELIIVIDAVHEAARYEQMLTEASPLMTRLFGATWQGPRSDWEPLQRLADYLILTHQRIARQELPVALLDYLAARTTVASHPPAQLAELVSQVETTLLQQRTILQAVLEMLQLNEVHRFGSAGRLQFQPFVTQLATMQAWTADLPALRLMTEWNNVAATIQAERLPELLLPAETWPEAAIFLAAAVKQMWLEHLQKLAYEQYPALRQFERAGHEEIAARFRQADRDSLYFNRVRAMRYHYEQLPNPQAGGQMLVLKNEFARKRGHKSLRRLMEEAGRAIQAIKPVFMMSPLSVASFLPPGAVEFDLVVFDEASQVKPVDALGAIARGRQLVVVGDSKQLPPTSFFDSLTGAAETDEENVTADMQSILELCKARQMPERMLRWHYRSLHQSLIAASNHLFYENKLVIFPSPGGHGQLGLVYHHLPATHYERGTTRTNPQEAAAVAEAVLHHARTTPKLTLGVVAFSTAQRQAIQNALEIRRKQHPETEAFFNRHAHEPFFVKNLENVQGDERDVILISIGYGRTKDGYLTMSFGPLNGEGGERRLNVLITRAKQRCEVFTNLTADDLDLNRTRAKGVAALKTFLNFAQHGRLNQNEETGREMDSPFEESVYRALTAQGYTIRPQIGSQGFYIDLAVVDPDQPGRYVIGIECDGAMYHSARSARDRDRLRQQVLEAVGWRLHRIWSTDWFRDPQRETERAIAAIEEARRLAAQDEPDEPEEEVLVAALTDLERETAALAEVTSIALPYQLAQLPAAARQQELHLHPVGRLAAWVTEVVTLESPVHVEEVTRRLASATGASQVGARIRTSVLQAIKLAENLGSVRLQGDFLWTPIMQSTTVPVRDRGALPAVSRKLAYVAAEEIAAAVLFIVQQSFAIEAEGAIIPAARLLGFNRLSEEHRQHVLAITQRLVAANQLKETNGVLRIAEIQ